MRVLHNSIHTNKFVALLRYNYNTVSMDHSPIRQTFELGKLITND